jgi:branched-chain amino acid transport system permease protein
MIEQTAPSSTEPVIGSPRRQSAGLWLFAQIVITGAILALVPLRYGDSRTTMNVATIGVLFAAYTIAFNLIFGSTGQLFLCVGALAGLGGYSSAILSDRYGVPLILSLVVAALVSGLVGGVLSWVAVSRRLDVIFTGVVTLAFSLSFDNLLLGQRDLTGGETGLVIDAGSGTFLRDRVPRYYVLLVLVLAYLVFYALLQRSHIGWAFRALRDDEVAAELAGVDVTRYRVFAGTAGSVMLGLAGALYAHGEGFISPTTFGFGRVDVRVLVMLALGGIGSLLGPVVGAAAFTILDEWLAPYSQLRLVYYGVAMLVLFLGFRRGVVPTVERILAASRRRRPKT